MLCNERNLQKKSTPFSNCFSLSLAAFQFQLCAKLQETAKQREIKNNNKNAQMAELDAGRLQFQ